MAPVPYSPRLFGWLVCLSLLTCLAGAVPQVTDEGIRTAVEGKDYRAVFTREQAGVRFSVRDAKGDWLPLNLRDLVPDFGLFSAGNPQLLSGARCGWSLTRQTDAVTVVWHAGLGVDATSAMQVVFVCTDNGILLGGRIANDGPTEGTLWFPPRFSLDPAVWDAYAFVDGTGVRHAGSLSDLDPCPAYAGVSPWEKTGDTVSSVNLLALRATGAGAGFGFIYLDAAGTWGGAGRFLQRHTPANLYLYPGHITNPGDRWYWAWLAPFPEEPEAQTALTARLQADAVRRLRGFTPDIPALSTTIVPDFPAELRRSEPVRDINEAVVYTVNETTNSDYAQALVRKTGTDLAIRGWFKWNRRPAVDQWTRFPGETHRLGALFGGGITCSALYDTENGITQEQLLDMVTRAPDGTLVDAWDTPGVRHGSLSSPAYLDYLFRWCREQIDAGADYLFMDEHTAVLSAREGYDHHSLRDFREYLLKVHPRTRDWKADDPRWRTELGIALNQPDLCPTGRIDSFDYRAYLRTNGWTERPTQAENPLASLWGEFRRWRDDRAWKSLTDRIRAYAAEQGRTVLISANGLAPYVDLQVLGVWGRWSLDQGHIDLRRNEIQTWRSYVTRGHQLAGRRVPVVLFHDWGFGDPPFPWLAAAPSEREIWMRTRGAEIYAAGAFFAFPVLGPFGCDAHRDGTLGTIASQAAFYQSHRDLYTASRWVGCEGLDLGDRPVSLAAWWHEDTRSLVVHIVNRDVREGVLHPVPGPVELQIPVAAQPEQAMLISPDFAGQPPAAARRTENGLALVLPGVEAYSVALLRFASQPDLNRLTDPIRLRPAGSWARPATADFRLRANGSVDHGESLNGFLQGMLHTHLRNPPVFSLNATTPGELRVRVKAVASTGAHLSVRIDDGAATVVDLPDLDGKNDGNAREYDRTFVFPFPSGTHRIALDNPGPDWLTIEWIEFSGRFAE